VEWFVHFCDVESRQGTLGSFAVAASYLTAILSPYCASRAFAVVFALKLMEASSCGPPRKERCTMLVPGYDPVKAAQVVAFFALKSGGRINVLKLAKLLYLAEREFMARYDEPMFYDRLVSMPDGPVTSITYNLINGDGEVEVWRKFVAPRDGYDISAAMGVELATLDELSVAEVEVLEHLWAKFSKFDRYALRDWTHKKENVPEWQDPKGSSKPIDHTDIFKHLGKSDAAVLAHQVKERRLLAKALARS
jgi:uncharacterized phage-associated protein